MSFFHVIPVNSVEELGIDPTFIRLMMRTDWWWTDKLPYEWRSTLISTMYEYLYEDYDDNTENELDEVATMDVDELNTLIDEIFSE